MSISKLDSVKEGEIISILNRRIYSKLKTDDTDIYDYDPSYNKQEPVEQKSKFDQLNFLFPSINTNDIAQFITVNKDISLEEGIRQFQQLSLSDKNHNKSNFLENKNCNKTLFFSSKFNKFKNRKRNYQELNSFNIDNSSKAEEKKIIETNTHINKINNQINNVEIKKELKPVELQVNHIEEEERNKRVLKTVDVIAKELLQSKNEKDLRKYFTIQLEMLFEKKEMEYQIENAKKYVVQLGKDQVDLRKCNMGVSSSYIKKKVEEANLDRKIDSLSKEIEKVKNSLCYHHNMGDFYSKQLSSCLV